MANIIVELITKRLISVVLCLCIVSVDADKGVHWHADIKVIVWILRWSVL